MASNPKKISRPWVQESKPFDRERSVNDFDYNGRRWRKVRSLVLSKRKICDDCEAEGVAVIATVVDHEPPAKDLIARGLDPYDEQYLFPKCKHHHNSKSGRERHRRGMGSNL